ncbi:MAG: hypothetical protein JWR69_3446 [Pedosphaera sp.]|nr:hypothetical protein [Pedosphaera sp.]
MPTEPERDIEKTLKAYAEKRREQSGAPLELHAATRRLLQGEAARLGAEPPLRPISWWGFLSALRPSFASISIFVVLGCVCVSMLLPALSKAKRKSARTMAAAASHGLDSVSADKLTVSNVGELAYSPLPQPVDRVQREVAGERKTGVLAKDLAERSLGIKPDTGSLQDEMMKNKADGYTAMPAAPAPSEVAARRYRSEESDLGAKAETAAGLPQVKTLNGGIDSTTPRLDIGWDVNTAGLVGALGVASKQGPGEAGIGSNVAWGAVVAQNAPAPVSSAFNDAEALNLSNAAGSAGSATQQFTRVQNGASNQNASGGAGYDNALLNSFRVEQKGDQMRIIDADGSSYSGFLQNADSVKRRQSGDFDQSVAANNLKQQVTNTLKLTEAAKATNAEPAVNQNYFFRVTGVNRSLNQSVLFSGTLATEGKAERGPRINFQGAPGDSPSSGLPGGFSLPWSQTQVRGQALIGGSNVIEVNAAPSGR